MKAAQTTINPFYFNASTATTPRRVDHDVEFDDDLGRKQEIVCGAILGLSLVSSMVVCFWQLSGH